MCVKMGHVKTGSVGMSQQVTVGHLNSPSASPRRPGVLVRLFLSPYNLGGFETANVNHGLVWEMGKRRARTGAQLAGKLV